MFGCLSRRFAYAIIACAVSGAANAADTSRIVSIGGAVTEILYALGADKNIVAVDTRASPRPAPRLRRQASAICARCQPKACLGCGRH